MKNFAKEKYIDTECRSRLTSVHTEKGVANDNDNNANIIRHSIKCPVGA